MKYISNSSNSDNFNKSSFSKLKRRVSKLKRRVSKLKRRVNKLKSNSKLLG